MILSCQKFTVLDGILYHVEGDKILRVVVYETDRECYSLKHMQEYLEDI